MAMQLSIALRNAILDGIETLIGAGAILMIRSGAKPANLAAADSGDVLATLELPADWMAAANAGSKTKSGTWEDLHGDMDGTAGHFRIYTDDPSGPVPHLQGSVSVTGAGGDMTLNSTAITTGKTITVTTFTINAGNA
jgi:hypothetical protein